jgi:nucleoid-associated protein EbfC
MDWATELDEINRQAEEQQKRIEEVRRSIERMEITGRSRNNGVLAKIRGTGQLTDVTFDPRVLQRYDLKSIGAFVVEAVNDAMAKLGQVTQEKFAPFLADAEAQLAAAQSLRPEDL